MKASQSPYRQIDAVSTGLPQLDRITGIGGVPMRRITEITGPFSVGKTTLSFNIISQAQKMGLSTLFSDIEYTFSEDHATMCGIDLDELDLIQERFAEDSLDQIEEWVSKHKRALVVLDSIGGLHPRAEGEKEMGGRTIGGQASLVAKFCRKIVPLLVINDVALVVLNHEFTDVMSGVQMTSGGAKLAFHKSMWLKLKFKSGVQLKEGDRRVGDVVIVQVRKNKLAPTKHQECELQFIFGRGFSPEADLLRDALEKGLITKQGNSFLFEGKKLAVGLAKMRKYLEGDPELAEKLKALMA